MTPPDDVQGGGMDAELPAPAQVTARVTALIERGLERYGIGDLAGAMGEWEHALALEPGAARALEYINYVRDNFKTLDEQFAAAREVTAASRASGVPVPEEPEEVSGAYDLVELERGQWTPVGVEPGRASARAGESAAHVAPVAIDEGWELDDLAAPLPPPPSQPRPPSATGLDADLAEVAAGLSFKDTGAPIPLIEPPRSELVDYGSGGDGDEDSGQVLEMEADEPDEPDEPTRPPDVSASAPDTTSDRTVPGGSEPPALPDRPSLSADAIAALGGRVPTVTIQPRLRQAGEGTNPGTAPGIYPGELPAPPHVATPSELVLELNTLEPGGGIAGFDGEGGDDNIGIELGDSLDGTLGARDPQERDRDRDRNDDDAETEALEPGVGEPVTSALLGLAGDETGEATRPAGALKSLSLLPDELPTIARGNVGLSGPPAAGLGDDGLDLESDVDGDFEDQPRTSERQPIEVSGRSPFGGDTAAGATEGINGAGHKSSPGSPAVIVDEQLLRALDDASDDGEITNARARLPSDVEQMSNAGDAAPVSGATDEDRIRRRVSELLQLAREGAERGDHLSAVEAAEAAAAEDPDGKIGPVILHRHRDLLYRVYEGHIGEMTQVPLLAVPLHQIAAERLDHRTGFLLSRIDGLLSFEDILDVAGMPRLDAYRILSNLLRRGFIEVR